MHDTWNEHPAQKQQQKHQQQSKKKGQRRHGMTHHEFANYEMCKVTRKKNQTHAIQ